MDVTKFISWPLVFLVFCLMFKDQIKSLLNDISWLKTRWFELKRIREEIFAKAGEVKKLSKELDQDKQELRKAISIFAETLYLALYTRHKFPIPQKVSEEITKNLNSLANLAIKGKREEVAFKKRMKEMLALLEQPVFK